MAVEYKVKAIGKPGVLGGGEIKYYASISRGKKMQLRKIIAEIADYNVAHPGTVYAVLEAFLSRINYHLAYGRAVDLGSLGSFYPSLSSSPSDLPEKVSKENIKRLKVLFRPSAQLQETLDVVKFEKIGGNEDKKDVIL